MGHTSKYSIVSDVCGALTKDKIGDDVRLAGWVQRRRDHGGLIFLDLRDRSGIVQVVVDPSTPEPFSLAEKIRSEYVLQVTGKVHSRPPGTVNPALPTGEVEVKVTSIKIFNSSKTPPFEIDDDMEIDENLRLRYRYLDLRRPSMMANFVTRHKITAAARQFLNENDFLDIDTPILTKSTPEGARDFLVASRTQPGHFYALPQSPQLFKQVLMVGGVERYYQIARCFRDEDLRADRQPEYTQVDIEMSFAEQNDILALVEGLMTAMFAAIDIEMETPFPRMSYHDALKNYGTDKPDLRFELIINDLTDIFADSDFKVFAGTIAKGGIVRALKVSPLKEFTRKELDDLTQFSIDSGAKGLAWFVVESEDKVRSPIAKFLSENELTEMVKAVKAQPGDVIFAVADNAKIVPHVLGALRMELARRLDLVPPKAFNFLWVTDFPLFQYNEEEKRLDSEHHPFTMPNADSLSMLDDKPLEVVGEAYDLVLNGTELGSGTLRIHERSLQEKILKMIGLQADEIEEKFGFLLEALEYGAPPHGGVALGLDRLAMLIVGGASIRDVIAFPKTQSAACLLTGAPDEVNEKYLRELGIKIRKRAKSAAKDE